jgi:vacuolar-type H+-ATPase subunit F/Vma7
LRRVAVITDPDLAIGFRLAGVEVRGVDSPKEAIGVLRELLAGDYGLIAINDDYLAAADRETARLVSELAVPVVVPFPAGRVSRPGEAEEYVGSLVRSCIGYSVKLR